MCLQPEASARRRLSGVTVASSSAAGHERGSAVTVYLAVPVFFCVFPRLLLNPTVSSNGLNIRYAWQYLHSPGMV